MRKYDEELLAALRDYIMDYHEYFCGGFILPHADERLGLVSYPFCTLQLVGDLAPQKAC